MTWDPLPAVEPVEVEPGRLRSALGRFVSGVTIVTTATADGRGVHGMTANSFSSVSLHPPLVQVSVATGAHLHARIGETGRYGVSILGQHQVRLAEHFAGRTAFPGAIRFVWRDGLPLIESALAQLTCSVTNPVSAGDHTIYLARVDTVTERDGPPLVFHRGRLRGLEPAGAELPLIERMPLP